MHQKQGWLDVVMQWFLGYHPPSLEEGKEVPYMGHLSVFHQLHALVHGGMATAFYR